MSNNENGLFLSKLICPVQETAVNLQDSIQRIQNTDPNDLLVANLQLQLELERERSRAALREERLKSELRDAEHGKSQLTLELKQTQEEIIQLKGFSIKSK